MDSIREILFDLLGEYTPVTYINAEDLEVIPSGFAGVDWVWVCSAVLLIVMIYSVFRIVRCLIAR